MKTKQNTLSATVDNRKGSNIGPPPKPCFFNYEEFIFAYVKSRRSEDYLKTEMELKLFE